MLYDSEKHSDKPLQALLCLCEINPYISRQFEFIRQFFCNFAMCFEYLGNDIERTQLGSSERKGMQLSSR